MKKIESVSKCTCVFIFLESASANDVVNPFVLHSPLEGSKKESPTPTEAELIAAPLEIKHNKILWHFIPVKIAMIPIVVRKTKKDEMNPLGEYFDREFPNILNLDTQH